MQPNISPGQLKGKRVYSGSQLEGIQSIIVGKSWWQEGEVGSHLVSIVRKEGGREEGGERERERDGAHALSFPRFYSIEDPRPWDSVAHIQSGLSGNTDVPRSMLPR